MKASRNTLVMKALWKLCSASFAVVVLTGPPADGQVDNPNEQRQLARAADGSAASQTETTNKPEVIITAPQAPLPSLPPDQFSNCMRQSSGGPHVNTDPTQAVICQAQLDWEKRKVIEACVNPNGNVAPPRIIQACTELLDHKFFEGRDRFFLFANRGKANYVQGNKAQAREDFDQAVKLAPQNADVYYDRGLFYAVEADADAAIRDFDTAIGLNPKLVPALRQRAKVYQSRDNFTAALQDYADAIRLQPKNAVLWGERGYVSLRQHDYQRAVSDEAQAISLDPKLAWAYFLRGAAFGDLGDSLNASSDIKTAVGLDPSLANYVVIKDKRASLRLPAPPG